MILRRKRRGLNSRVGHEPSNRINRRAFHVEPLEEKLLLFESSLFLGAVGEPIHEKINDEASVSCQLPY